VRALVAVMMGMEPPTAEEAAVQDGEELDELALSAVGEAANQMMAAAAAATATVLGQEVDISTPEVRVVTSARDALTSVVAGAAVVAVPFDVLGHACRLVQVVPHAFVVRMTRALDDLEAEAAGATEEVSAVTHEAGLPADVLGGISVRVAAEVGRATMTIRRAVNLAPGAVVELDRALEDPIDLYVNGRRFATGRLVTVDGEELAVHIDTVALDVHLKGAS
jgi:flagellar motor switch protein FliN/FliY